MRLMNQGKVSAVFGGCLYWAVCVCAGWQTMGAVTSSWGTSKACPWVHNRAAEPLVIGNNSPSSPGSGVVNFGLEGDPLRGATAGAVCATGVVSETGNEWKKEAETTLCCQITGLIGVWAGSRRCSVSHQGEKKTFFLSQILCKPRSQGSMQFCHSTPRAEITHLLLVGREKERGGRGRL